MPGNSASPRLQSVPKETWLTEVIKVLKRYFSSRRSKI